MHNILTIFFVFSVFQWFKPKIYVFWVVFWMLFYTSMLSLDIYYNRDLKGEYFIYLTNWSYLLQASHVYIDFGVTIFTHIKRKDIRDGKYYEKVFENIDYILYMVLSF